MPGLAPERRLLARRMLAPPPRSVTAAECRPVPGRSRHGEHPGARVSVAETLIGGACQQPRFAESDVRHSRRMMRSTLPGTDVYARDLDTPTPRARRCRFNTLTSTDGPITRIWSLPVQGYRVHRLGVQPAHRRRVRARIG